MPAYFIPYNLSVGMYRFASAFFRLDIHQHLDPGLLGQIQQPPRRGLVKANDVGSQLLDLLQMSDAASTVLTEARRRFPEEQWVPEATVRRLWQAGRVDEALAELERAERDFDSLDSGLLRLSVVVLVAAEREEEARPALESD